MDDDEHYQLLDSSPSLSQSSSSSSSSTTTPSIPLLPASTPLLSGKPSPLLSNTSSSCGLSPPPPPMSSGGGTFSDDDGQQSSSSSSSSTYSGHQVNAEDLQFRTACLLILVLIIVDLVMLSLNPALLRIEFHATWLQKTIILGSVLAVLAYGFVDQFLVCLRRKQVVSRRAVEQALDFLFFGLLYLAAIPSLVVIIAYELLYLALQLGGYVPMDSPRS